MGRISTMGELDALDRLALELDAIKRQFSKDDRLRVYASRAVTPASGSADVAIDDWDDLFDAVKARLRLAVSESRRGTDGASASFQACVLDCAAALDQLHTMLHRELGHRQRLELEALVVQSAVAPAGHSSGAGHEAARPGPLPEGLTLPPQRGLFSQRLDHLLDPAAPERPSMALLYLDLDGFQPLTDQYGLEAGDELLRIVEARLLRTVGAQDIVTYLGADEFACLRITDGTDRKQVSQLACTLFDAVSVPLTIGPLALSVRPSIGIAMYPDDGRTSETLLQRADAAMVRAKRQQTGYAFFDQRTER